MGDKPERPGDRVARVLGMPGLPHTKARLLAVIALYDGENGAYPSASRIGRDAGGMAERTVRNHITQMVEMGALAKRKGQRGDHYSINYDWRSDRPTTGRSRNLRCGHSDRPNNGRQTGRPPADDSEDSGILSAPPAQREIPSERNSARATDGLRAGGAPPAAPSPPPPAKPKVEDETMAVTIGERSTVLPPTDVLFCGKCNASYEHQYRDPVWNRPCVRCGKEARLYEEADPNLPAHPGPPVPRHERRTTKTETGSATEVLAAIPVTENQTPCGPLDLAELNAETDRLATIGCHFHDADDPNWLAHAARMNEHAARCIGVGLSDPWARMRRAA